MRKECEIYASAVTTMLGMEHPLTITLWQLAEQEKELQALIEAVYDTDPNLVLQLLNFYISALAEC